MKNLMIYVNPNGFDEESKKLVKIQIDNSLDLGWKPEEILLVTNFPYEYSGIKALVLNDTGYFDYFKPATKYTVLSQLFDMGLIEDKVHMMHDLDAFQLVPITQEELGIENLDAAFCDYGRLRLWQLGCFYFKKSAEDIIRYLTKRIIEKRDTDKEKSIFKPIDEYTLLEITDNNEININSRIKKLNGAYLMGMRRLTLTYPKAEKPLKMLHFHPESKILNTLDIAMRGRNRLGIPLMNDRLINIFKRYGYT